MSRTMAMSDSMKSGKFELQFDPTLIPSLVHQYMTTGKGAEKDAAMAAAGQSIVDGQWTRANVEIVYRWKSARSVRHLLRNEEPDVDRCLQQAIQAIKAQDDRSAMTALIRIRARRSGLHGFQVPLASAILTALCPKRFTVIDYKALNSLGCPQDSPNVDFYLEYLRASRDISGALRICLRTLDRALWQWWKNKETSGASPAC
jgi:hypothetical protein